MNEVHHTTERLLFEDIGGKKLEVDFDGGEVSSDAGVLFLREVERRMKLLDRVAKVLHDRRHPSYTRHSLLDMLKQRVFQIACGYEDAFYESLNLAALLGVPVLFVFENNRYSTITPQPKRQAALDVIAKAHSFGLDGVSIDGNDAVQVYETSLQAMDNIRQSQRSFLIEAVTYRLCAHVRPGSDFGSGRRPETELEEWRSREPLGRLASRIVHEWPDAVALISAAQVLAEIDTAFESAKRRFDEVNARVGLAAPKPPDPSRV